MKQINNYIQEKLHISKKLKLDTKQEAFRKYLEKYGYALDLNRDGGNVSDTNSMEILPLDSEEGFPCIDILVFDDYFTDEFNTFESGELIIYETPSDSHAWDSDGFDVVKDKGYAYTEKNAALIAQELNTWK